MVLKTILSFLSLCTGKDVVISDQPVTHYIRQTDIPYVITTAGSYALAENIVAPSSDAITINVDGIGSRVIYVDLNGYSLSGNGALNGFLVQSSADTPAQTLVKLSNGTINGMTDHGLMISANLHGLVLDGLHTISCGASNSTASDASGICINGSITNQVISDCVACASAKGAGFYCASAGVVMIDCVARSNASAGFLCASAHGTIKTCLASANGIGFDLTADHASIYHCNAANNTGDGMNVSGEAAHITECEMMANGGNGCTLSGAGTVVADCVISGSGQSGIVSNTAATIKRNIIVSNGAQGIVLQASGNSVNDNDIDGNAGGGINIAFNANSGQIIGNKITNNSVYGMNDLAVLNNCIYSNFASNNTVNYHNVSFVNSPLPRDQINHTVNVSQ